MASVFLELDDDADGLWASALFRFISEAMKNENHLSNKEIFETVQKEIFSSRIEFVLIKVYHILVFRLCNLADHYYEAGVDWGEIKTCNDTWLVNNVTLFISESQLLSFCPTLSSTQIQTVHSQKQRLR